MLSLYTQKWSGGTLSLIFNLHTRWRRVVSIVSGLLYPLGKGPQYPLNKRLVGPQALFGCIEGEKKSVDHAGI